MKGDYFTIKGFMASAFAETGLITGDNRLKTEAPSGASGLTDTELRAAHLDVQQVSGSIDSTNIVSSVTLETLQVSGSIYSTNVVSAVTLDTIQVSGSVASTQSRLIARQTNPTAVADAAISFASSAVLANTIALPPNHIPL